MKIHLAPLCFFVLLGISCTEQTSDLDNTLLPCYTSTYEAEGHDLKSAIDAHEKKLIEEGVLPNGSGASYMELWRSLNVTQNFQMQVPSFRESDPLQQAGTDTQTAIFQCQYEKIAVLKEKDSRWDSVFPVSTPGEPAPDPEVIFRAMVETMSEADFNSYYFRLKMFQMLDMEQS